MAGCVCVWGVTTGCCVQRPVVQPAVARDDVLMGRLYLILNERFPSEGGCCCTGRPGEKIWEKGWEKGHILAHF